MHIRVAEVFLPSPSERIDERRRCVVPFVAMTVGDSVNEWE